MPYETLIDALLEEGRTKSEAIVCKAKTEAERLVHEAQQQCQILDRETDATIRRTRSTQRTAILSSARPSVRHVLLQAKREILDTVWRDAGQKAMTLTGNARTAILNLLLNEILSVTSSQSPRVLIDSRERPYLEDFLKERRIHFEEQQQDDLRLGIRLEADGEVLTNSFAGRLAKAKPELTIELNRLLFTEDPARVQPSAATSKRER